MFSIDSILKEMQEQLNVLQNTIAHCEKDKEAFKILTKEIRIVNDIISNLFKYKELKM